MTVLLIWTYLSGCIVTGWLLDYMAASFIRDNRDDNTSIDVRPWVYWLSVFTWPLWCIPFLLVTHYEFEDE